MEHRFKDPILLESHKIDKMICMVCLASQKKVALMDCPCCCLSLQDGRNVIRPQYKCLVFYCLKVVKRKTLFLETKKKYIYKVTWKSPRFLYFRLLLLDTECPVLFFEHFQRYFFDFHSKRNCLVSS